MLTHTARTEESASESIQRKIDLDKRLAILFWPLLLILVGTLWLFPPERVPSAMWLIGIGVILLSLNAARLANGIPVRVLPTILGALALAAGLADVAGAALALVPLSLIAIGLSVILELFAARKTPSRGGER